MALNGLFVTRTGTQVLEKLGMQAAGLKREFYLSQVPVVDTVRVRVVEDGEELAFQGMSIGNTCVAEIACVSSATFQILCRKC